MSQFIETQDKLIDWQNVNLDLVRGVLSKIFNSSSPALLTQTANQRYFSNSIKNKLLIEAEDAFKIHHQSMITNYHRLKSNLAKYARSRSHKLQHVFEKSLKDKSETQQPNMHRTASCTPGRLERVIFIDRKYNKELSTKTAILSELEQISQLKQAVKKSKSAYDSPLVDKIYLKRTTYQPFSVNKDNPILKKPVSSLLQRKKRRECFFKK